MIQPGLERIQRLLLNTPLRWKAIHVAGTNGKGSICAAVSAMLHATGVRCGRFTSPHLIDRWDCININERPVSEAVFKQAEAEVMQLNNEQQIKASEFELLTATAFNIFNRERLEYAVVEVGMGGLQDATNVIANPAVTVISKISLDHQNFLGNTIEEIAFQKAGIIKSCVPCIVDGNNNDSVLEVVKKKANEMNAPLIIRKSLPKYKSQNVLWRAFQGRSYQTHQQNNLGLAYQAMVTASEQAQLPIPSPSILGTIPKDHWPGRTQYISVKSLTGRKTPVLIDGAHNLDSARVLAKFIPRDQPNIWLISMSSGKNAKEILRPLLRDGDSVFTVAFGPVDGMPWVKPMDTKELASIAGEVASLQFVQSIDGNVAEAIREVSDYAHGKHMVITGSLYLVSDVLRTLRDIPKAIPSNLSLNSHVRHDPSSFVDIERSWTWS